MTMPDKYAEARALANSAATGTPLGPTDSMRIGTALLSALAEVETANKLLAAHSGVADKALAAYRERDSALRERDEAREANREYVEMVLKHQEKRRETESARAALAGALRDARRELEFARLAFGEMDGSGPAHASRILAALITVDAALGGEAAHGS